MRKIRLTALILASATFVLPSQAATYIEAGGIVVIEAEHFDKRTTNSSDQHHWAIMPDENGMPDTAADGGFSGARGNKYMQSLPDSAGGGSSHSGSLDQVGIDPYLDYKVQITTPGEYRLWLRWGGYDGSSDSMYAQIRELMTPAGPGPDFYKYAANNAGTFGAWSGVGTPSTDTANAFAASGGEVAAVWPLSAGTYTIRLSMREDGSGIDALILQLSSLPAPTSPGPFESQSVGDISPPTLVDAGTFGNPSGVTLVFSEALSRTTAINKANYSINNGVTVTSAAMGPNDLTVVLTTSTIPASQLSTVTVSGVQDVAGNAIKANSTLQFFKTDGVIERRVFNNISGNSVDNLTADAKFTGDKPDEVTYPTSFQGPTNFRDNYGTQFRGYVTAPVTGNYVFFISTDDNGALFLSTDENPANKKQIAAETTWSNARQWVTSGGSSDLAQKRSDQAFGTIALTAGKRYYIEALQKEGGGGDNIAVTWMLPGAAEPVDGAASIPGKYLSAFASKPAPITITTQPVSATVVELLPVTFSVAGTGFPPPTSYQWFRDGAPIGSALGPSYTISSTKLSDNGAKLTALVANGYSSATSVEVTLTVTADKTPPVLLGARGSPSQTQVVLTFSEGISQASATALANYKISTASGAALNVSAASLSADATKVTLTTAKQTVGTKYVVTVNNIKDNAATANTIASDSKTAFFPAGKIVQDASGLIVFEAESFDRNLDNLWMKDTTRGSPSGGASMVVPSGGSESATQLEYDIEFKKTGTHIIWYRASGNDGGSDSGWFHIDKDREPNRVDGNQSSMTGFSGALDFVWLSNPQDGGGQFTFEVPTAGPHIVAVARRENNAYFDKFIITTDPAFVPTGFGPPETREGLPAPPTVTLTSPTDGQKFSTGANITLSANASGATGIDVARVEFSANGTVVGTATKSPFNFTWSNVKDGTYTIRAIAIDEVSGATTSAPIVIKVGTPPPLIYFVTADPGPLTFAGDIAVQQRLLKRGFDVQLARGSDVPADGSTARGSSLIIQSSSLGSGTVENNGVGKFRFLDIPAMVWESSSEDAFAFQEANGATTAGQTQINIVDATSPLAAGLPKGLVTVSASEPYSQGTPEGAHIVATLADDPTQAVIYNYEKGDKGFNGFVMPARRVFFFFGDNTAAVATADGVKLFDAAVDWLLGGQVVIPPKPAQFTKITKNADGSITVEWTGGGTLQAAASITGPWQDVPGAASPYKFTPAAGAPMLFGRIKN